MGAACWVRIAVVIFFFCCGGDDRDLHSFPTRRSSDLVTSAARPTTKASAWPWTARATPTLPRSEEHTSELQSHHDLVCRLLLEKKKILHRKREGAGLHQFP